MRNFACRFPAIEVVLEHGAKALRHELLGRADLRDRACKRNLDDAFFDGEVVGLRTLDLRDRALDGCQPPVLLIDLFWSEAV